MTVSPRLRAVLHLPPAVNDTAAPTPRWVLRLAYAMPWFLLPSCLWRLPFAFHFTMGMEPTTPPEVPLLVTIPYVFGLSIITELIAFLCIGLVRRWGEVIPAPLPFSGRVVHPWAAGMPALLGGLILVALFSGVPVDGHETFTLIAGTHENVTFINGWWQALAAVCTTPLRFWGAAVIVLSIAYLVRRRHDGLTRSAAVSPT